MKFTIALLGLLLFSLNAEAHTYIEPGFGFEYGSSKQSIVSSNSPTVASDYSVNGFTYGAALGYRYHFYFLGAQYEKGLSGHVTDINAFVGGNIAIRVRVWFSYIFSSKDDVSSGSGYKMGVGVAVFKLFSVNGEYSSRSYNKYTGPLAYTGLTYSGSTNTFRLTVSLPSPRPF